MCNDIKIYIFASDRHSLNFCMMSLSSEENLFEHTNMYSKFDHTNFQRSD